MNSRSLLIALLFCTTAFAQVRRHQPSPTPAPTPGPKPVMKVDLTGKFDGQHYVNDGLGFELNLPEGWQFQSSEVNEKFAEKASQTTNEFSGGTKATEQSLARTKILFIAIKPTDNRTNPTVLGMAEDVSLIFNVRSPRQYLEAMRLTVNDRVPIIFGDRITDEVINGVPFSFLGASARDANIMAAFNTRQRYYVTLRNNFAIAFVITYHSPEELDLGLEMFKAVKFK